MGFPSMYEDSQKRIDEAILGTDGVVSPPSTINTLAVHNHNLNFDPIILLGKGDNLEQVACQEILTAIGKLRELHARLKLHYISIRYNSAAEAWAHKAAMHLHQWDWIAKDTDNLDRYEQYRTVYDYTEYLISTRPPLRDGHMKQDDNEDSLLYTVEFYRATLVAHKLDNEELMLIDSVRFLSRQCDVLLNKYDDLYYRLDDLDCCHMFHRFREERYQLQHPDDDL